MKSAQLLEMAIDSVPKISRIAFLAFPVRYLLAISPTTRWPVGPHQAEAALLIVEMAMYNSSILRNFILVIYYEVKETLQLKKLHNIRWVRSIERQNLGFRNHSCMRFVADCRSILT